MGGCVFIYIVFFAAPVPPLPPLPTPLQPSQEGLVLVQHWLHIVEDGDEIGPLQRAQVHVCAGQRVQEVGESRLLWQCHVALGQGLSCRGQIDS